METADTRYDHTRPWQSAEENLISAGLAASQAPADTVRAIRPPVPQLLFRPRQGYAGYADRQLRITDLATLVERFPQQDYSGRVSGYQGSSRNGFPALNTF